MITTRTTALPRGKRRESSLGSLFVAVGTNSLSAVASFEGAKSQDRILNHLAEISDDATPARANEVYALGNTELAALAENT